MCSTEYFSGYSPRLELVHVLGGGLVYILDHFFRIHCFILVSKEAVIARGFGKYGYHHVAHDIFGSYM